MAEDMAPAAVGPAVIAGVLVERLDIEEAGDEEGEAEEAEIGLAEAPFLVLVDVAGAGEEIAFGAAAVAVDLAGGPAAERGEGRKGERGLDRA